MWSPPRALEALIRQQQLDYEQSQLQFQRVIAQQMERAKSVVQRVKNQQARERAAWEAYMMQSTALYGPRHYSYEQLQRSVEREAQQYAVELAEMSHQQQEAEERVAELQH
jgi:hypothetical protein